MALDKPQESVHTLVEAKVRYLCGVEELALKFGLRCAY